MIKKIVLILLTLVISSTSAFAEVNVVATLPWIGSVVKEIGKDKINLTVLVKPNQDPHFAEAKPSMILAANKADILMYNGLDLEVGYLPLILKSSRNPKIQPGQIGNFDCSLYVDAIEKPRTDIDRSMGDVHPFGNPHYHLSPQNILKVTEVVAETLSYIDPPNAEFYRANLASYKDRLREKESVWGKNLKGKKFIAFHKYFEYLAKDYGFQITDYIEPKPGIPPSSGHIGSLIEIIRKTQPDGLLSTAYYGKKEVEYLSQKTGVKGIVVPHDVGSREEIRDWFILMDKVMESLK
jgi:zinc/manganese transport system substrate-binding protein